MKLGVQKTHVLFSNRSDMSHTVTQPEAGQSWPLWKTWLCAAVRGGHAPFHIGARVQSEAD